MFAFRQSDHDCSGELVGISQAPFESKAWQSTKGQTYKRLDLLVIQRRNDHSRPS